tara:strand:+ start:2799 stop:3941 length:1143 start_codon:yes stop_codon:yes gene_type:complete
MTLSSSFLATQTLKTNQTTQKTMSFQNFTAKSRQQNSENRGNRGNRDNRGNRNSRGNRNKPQAPPPRPKPVYIPLLEREPHQVVGSAEWGLYQRHMAIMEGRTVQTQLSVTPTVKHSQMNTVGVVNRNAKGFKESLSTIQKNKQGQLIDQIVNYTNGNKWMQLNDGENEKKWVNPAYDDKIFDTGRIIDAKTGEPVYFPISNKEHDPLGLAMHFVVATNGASYTIYHNGFTPYGNAQDRRYWKYLKKRKARLAEEFKHRNRLNDEELREMRLKKYGPEKTAELEKMDKRNKQTNEDIVKKNTNQPSGQSNQPSGQSNQPSGQSANKGGVSIKVMEKNDNTDDADGEVIMFSGPTPAEALQTNMNTPRKNSLDTNTSQSKL